MHAACWVTKQLIASHKAKERIVQGGTMATEAKDWAKVKQKDLPKAKVRE